MNQFEKIVARFGGSMAYYLLKGQWKEAINQLEYEHKSAAQKLSVRFIDRHEDERRESQGEEGEMWAIYAYKEGEETKHYKVEGRIDSYGRDDGFVGFHEVEGVEVTVTKFKPKN